MRVVVGADHGGYALKEILESWLASLGHEVEDVGTHAQESVDYPVYAHAVARRIADGRAQLGVLICGTGIGMSLAANRHPGVRAALVSEPWSAAMARRHNDAQVLCMGGRVTGPDLAKACVEAWMVAEFEGGRHGRRVGAIDLEG